MPAIRALSCPVTTMTSGGSFWSSTGQGSSVLLLRPAEGIDGLQNVCNNEVWLSEDNSVILNLQASARLNRKGQTRRVNRFSLQ